MFPSGSWAVVLGILEEAGSRWNGYSVRNPALQVVTSPSVHEEPETGHGSHEEEGGGVTWRESSELSRRPREGFEGLGKAGFM